MADSYFMPPVTERVPRRARAPQAPNSPRYFGLFLSYWRGVSIGPNEPPEFQIGTREYQGGRWNGPLSSAEIAEITAAGFGARIFTVTDLGQLPADIDS